MTINTNNTVTFSEATEDFSKVARLVDENGSAIILKNNAPRYIIMELPQAEELRYAADEAVEEISQRLIEKNLEAYKELAK